MANPYLVSNLIASAKRRGLIAPSAETFNESDFLQLANDEMQTYVLPLLRDSEGDHLEADVDLVVTAADDTYDIPARAVVMGLQDVLLSNGNGGWDPLDQLQRRKALRLTAGGPVQGYYLQGNQLVLVPAPTAAGTLRLSYTRRPGRLVAADAVGEILAINTATKQVTLTATAPGTFTAAVLFDFVKASPGFECRAIDQALTSVADTVLTFTAALPAGLAVGDFVCLAEESPVPQVPVEVHPLLATRITYVCEFAQGDKRAAITKELCAEMRASLLTMLQPRVNDSPEYVTNDDAPGQRSGTWRRW